LVRELLPFSAAVTCAEAMDAYFDISLAFSHSKNRMPSLVYGARPKWQYAAVSLYLGSRRAKLKSGAASLSLYGDHTNLRLNPSGKFIIGGPQGDAGLTGRKIIIDTYGGWGAHGGGAFSGKDPTKVDRSAAYICRQMAKSVVKSGLSKRCLVQLSYAIGVAKPLSLFVETYGTECGGLTPDDITNVLKIEFDCRPGAIAITLALREPKYQETAAYCHFGRQPVTKDGMKFFEWENAKDLSKYKSMNSEQVSAELKASNYLTKWVD